MRRGPGPSSHRSTFIARLAVALALATLLPGCVGCGGEAPRDDEDALRARFPEEAARVLDGRDALVATDGGFALEAPDPAARGALGIRLPVRGDGEVRLALPDGFEVRVRERGADGEGAPAGRAVAYARAGGTSFWTVVDGGYEEWLSLDAGVARDGEAVASWEVAGAALRQRGEVVDVVDDAGAARITVAAPVAYAAGGRAIAPRIMVRGGAIELFVDGADGAPVLVDPSWTAGGTMGQGRNRHQTVVLQNGKVMVAGGNNLGLGTNTFASVELYDPAANAWTTVAPMTSPRWRFALTLLPNGRVLATGGYNTTANNPTALTSVEVYDVASNTWIPATPMGTPRAGHGAAQILGGKILVAGGQSSNTGYLSSAEIYDPVANTWTAVASMVGTRAEPVLLPLPSGKAIVVGGWNNVSLGTAEIYDPVANTWTPAASLTGLRTRHTGTVTASGKVLVAGGISAAGVLRTAEIYDPAANAWTNLPQMVKAHSDHTATLLLGGGVLIAGGQDGVGNEATVELFDPNSNTWQSPAPPAMGTARAFHTAALLGNGAVLVTGGQPALTSTELYGSAARGAACVGAIGCQSGFCVDGVCCNTACNAGVCDACSTAAGAPTNGTCAPLTGVACDDGNACTQADACQAGVCQGTQVACPGADACHTAGTCNPQTGMCGAAVQKTNGATCDDNNACTQTDTCQSGICTGQNPVSCMALDACHVAGVCNAQTGLCSTPSKADGATCDDNNACTQTDTCQAGICTGGNLVTCVALDACHVAGVCNAQTGLCSTPSKADGSACNDNNACTQTDTCQAGICTGGNPVACAVLDACHVSGVCDAQTGLCSMPLKADGSACDDGNPCTQTDTCQEGACTGGNPVTCAALDECHFPGTCDAQTGVCTNPAAPDFAPCAGGACLAGVCVATPDGGTGGAGGTTTTGSTTTSGTTTSGTTTGSTTTGAGGGTTMTTSSTTTGAGGSATTGTTTNAGGGGALGGSSSSGSAPGAQAGCGCEVGAPPSTGGFWTGLVLLLAAARRRRARA